MWALVGAVLTWVGSFVADLFTKKAAEALIWRALLYGLFVTILPAVLYKLILTLMGEMFSLYTSQASGSGIVGFTANFTGLTAWFLSELRFPEAFSILLSAAVFRATISFIPFIGRM